MIRRALTFWGGCIALYLFLVMPFRILHPNKDLANAITLYAATALLLCLIPTTLTLLWSTKAAEQSAQQQLFAVLGGTGIRMFFVLLTAMGLYLGVDYFQKYNGFLISVLISYLVTLAWEMTIVVATKPTAGPVPPAQPTGTSVNNQAELVE